MELPIYEIVFSEGATLDRFSLVKKPAVENVSMYFNEELESIKFFAVEEKGLFYAPAMIPNKKIYRKDVKGNPANTFYTAETIEKFNENFSKKTSGKENNIEHTEEIADGVFLVENWIVHDNKNDKANALGFDVPNGTLMTCHKIENEAIKEKVKNGDLAGLSVEMFAKYELRESNTNKVNMEIEEKKGFIAEIIEGIKMAFEPKKVEEPAPVVEPVISEDCANLKAENEALKMQLQEATDALAQKEIEVNNGAEKSILMTAEIEELKEKIAFNVEIPKVPVTSILDDKDPIAIMKAGRRV